MDHKLTKTCADSLSLIDDFGDLEQNPLNAVEDELLNNLKIVKLHNILQLEMLKDKMQYEADNKNDDLHNALERSIRMGSDLFISKVRETPIKGKAGLNNGDFMKEISLWFRSIFNFGLDIFANLWIIAVEISQTKSKGPKPKRREAKNKDDSDDNFPELQRGTSVVSKRNPSRRQRNWKRKKDSLMESDFNIDDDDSEFFDE